MTSEWTPVVENDTDLDRTRTWHIGVTDGGSTWFLPHVNADEARALAQEILTWVGEGA